MCKMRRNQGTFLKKKYSCNAPPSLFQTMHKGKVNSPVVAVIKGVKILN